MKKHLLTVFALTAALTASSEVRVGSDGSATFTLKAPQARTVTVSGSFAKTPLTLRRDASGLWKGSTAPLTSDLHTYRMNIDGVAVADPSNYHVIHSDGVNQSFFIVPGERGDLLSVSDVPHGSLLETWIDQPSLGASRRTTVYLPPSWTPASGRRYPVLYLLHGLGGDETSWTGLGRAAVILDNLIAAGDAPEMIVVMPNGNVSLQAAPGHGRNGLVAHRNKLPRTMNGEFEKSFPDIVAWTDANLPTIATKESRAIAGLSMGGLNSLFISALNPDMFGWVGLFSPTPNPLYPTDSPVYQDVAAKLRRQFHAGGGPSLYYLAIGSKDFLYKDNVTFRATLDSLGAPYVYNETTGGHEWRNWRDYLADFVSQIFKTTP